MEHGLLFLIVIFLVLLFFLCRDPSGNEIVLYLLPKRFDQTFGRHQGLCSLSWQFSLSFIILIISSDFF